MKSFTTLLEQLTSDQQDYLYYHLHGQYYNPDKSHTEMFDSYPDKQNPHRIVLPLETNNLNDKVDGQLKIHLKTNGWDIHNYHAGLASKTTFDRDGKPKLEVRKIGKVLQQTGGDKVYHTQLKDRLIKGSDGKPLVGADGRYKSEKVKQSLSDFYNNDKTRDSVKAEHNIVISRDLDDIGGMTSGRDWEDDSCMRLPNHYERDEYSKDGNAGQYHEHIKDDLDHHTLIAYATKRGDDDIEDPVGRVLIKRYTGRLPNGEDHEIYRPETKTYGNLPDGFKNQVEELTHKHYPAKPDVQYQMHRDLYNDSKREIEPLKVGLHTDGNITRNYNSRGQLHDYVDEHGINQPAVDTPQEIGHYKNGVLHTDDDTPALISINGISRRYYHYKNGELHRDGDKPAIYDIYHDGDNKRQREEYYFGGIQHRSGNKPSYISKSPVINHIQYHHAGLLHRTDGPAVDEHNTWIGSRNTEYRINGQLVSPDDNTPAHKTINYSKDGTTYNGELYRNSMSMNHRDGDLPSLDITKTHNSGSTHLVEYSKNGKYHREGKPARITTDTNKNGDVIKTTQHYENGNPLKSETTPFEVKTRNGNLLEQRFNHNNINKPTIINHDHESTVSYFGNRKTGHIIHNENLDGTHHDVYKGDTDVNGEDNKIITYNNDPIASIKHRGFEGEMLKSDNGDLHILSLRDMVGYKLTPDNKISMYKIPSGTNVSDGDNRWKHFDDLAKRGYGDGRPMFLPDTVRKIKKHMATSEIPSKYTDMIDRFDKAVN